MNKLEYLRNRIEGLGIEITLLYPNNGDDNVEAWNCQMRTTNPSTIMQLLYDAYLIINVDNYIGNRYEICTPIFMPDFVIRWRLERLPEIIRISEETTKKLKKEKIELHLELEKVKSEEVEKYGK